MLTNFFLNLAHIDNVLSPHLFCSVPQKGTLLITTEFGRMAVAPNEICVIQVRLVL